MYSQIPSEYYNGQFSKHTAGHAAIAGSVKLFSRLRLLAIVLGLVCLYFAIQQEETWRWALVAGFAVAFIVFVRIHTRKEKELKLLQLHLAVTQQELAALNNDHSSFPDGNVFVNPLHPYSFDLDVFGKGSIYQLLCRSVTVNGAVLLADRLKDKTPDLTTIQQRQNRIKELSTQPGFLEDFRVAGLSVEEGQNDYTLLRTWLQEPDAFINSIIAKAAIFTMPVFSALFIVLSVIGKEINGWSAAVVAVNLLILGYFKVPIRQASVLVGKAASVTEKYAQLQVQMATANFTDEWLKQAASQSAESLKQVAQFNKLVHAFESRSNGMTGPVMNALFLYDIYCLLQLERWRKQHKDLLLQNLDTIMELDVLVSCGVYAFNHPGYTYPLFTEGKEIAAADIRHPLLAGHAVGNNCSIGKDEQLYLLTGANMTGKSTFIRTIGVSVLMSYLGIPVAADSFCLPLLNIYTSIRVTDSVQDDISYFRAELNRIKSLMTEVQVSPGRYLILLDEPLRGTNSADKQMGTRSMIEKLLHYNAIGIVATHDIALSTLEEEYPGKVHNYHFESRVVDNELRFDFQLHPGCSTSNNATLLMKMMGIVD